MSEANSPVVKGAKSLGWTFMASVMTSGGMAAISLLTGVLTARLLGTDGRGQVAAISTWLITWTWTCSFGFAHAVTYFNSKRQTSDGAALASNVCGSTRRCRGNAMSNPEWVTRTRPCRLTSS